VQGNFARHIQVREFTIINQESLKENKMKDKIEAIIEKHYDPDMETLKSGSTASEIKEYFLKFSSWIITDFVWIAFIKSKEKTIEDAYQYWLTIKPKDNDTRDKS
jgi:hypothetical protein